MISKKKFWLLHSIFFKSFFFHLTVYYFYALIMNDREKQDKKITIHEQHLYYVNSINVDLNTNTTHALRRELWSVEHSLSITAVHRLKSTIEFCASSQLHRSGLSRPALVTYWTYWPTPGRAIVRIAGMRPTRRTGFAIWHWLCHRYNGG